MHHRGTAKPPPGSQNSCLNGQISNHELIPTDLVEAGLRDINVNRLILPHYLDHAQGSCLSIMGKLRLRKERGYLEAIWLSKGPGVLQNTAASRHPHPHLPWEPIHILLR